MKVDRLTEASQPSALSDEEYAALVVQAESRARLDDGTVDPGLFALELSELLPVDPDPPRSDDAHARFHGDVHARRALFRNG